MEIKKGMLVMAFGANIDDQVHVRHPAKGDALGIGKRDSTGGGRRALYQWCIIQ
jgi:hypothetical protein